MKVAYNACYGGFGLSNLALDMYAKKKGIELFWYNEEDTSSGSKYVAMTREKAFSGSSYKYHAFTVSIDDGNTIFPTGSFYYPYLDDARSDLDLIEVIETLGDKANGEHADLQIAEIPDGADYEIDEYDGNESVVPPRQSW